MKFGQTTLAGAALKFGQTTLAGAALKFGQTTLVGAALKFGQTTLAEAAREVSQLAELSTGKKRDLFRHATLFLSRMRDVTWTMGFSRYFDTLLSIPRRAFQPIITLFQNINYIN